MTTLRDLRAKDIMVTKPLTFSPDRRLLDAVRVLIDQRIPGAPVVDERGNLIGVLTEQSFLEAVVVAGYHAEGAGRVGDHLNERVETIGVDTSLFDIARRFIETGYRWFPVVDENRLVGVVARRELLRAVINGFGWRRSGMR